VVPNRGQDCLRPGPSEFSFLARQGHAAITNDLQLLLEAIQKGWRLGAEVDDGVSCRDS